MKVTWRQPGDFGRWARTHVMGDWYQEWPAGQSYSLSLPYYSVQASGASHILLSRSRSSDSSRQSTDRQMAHNTDTSDRSMFASNFAGKLRCLHCGNPNKMSEWPVRGDSVPFVCSADENRIPIGGSALRIQCAHCGQTWYVVWDQHPGPLQRVDVFY